MTAPDREPHADDASWRRHLRAAATERLGLKLIALAIALLLWLVVRLAHVAAGVGGAP